MSTEKDLMKLVADYGKECISAGMAELNRSDDVKQRMADDVRTAHVALTDRLRALLTELEEAREDAARYRWLMEQSWFQSAFDRFDPDDYGRIDLFKLECNRIIDAARKGEA